MAGMQEQGPAPRAQGPGQRQRVLALLSQPCPRIQAVLQFLPGHESGGGRALPEGCADRSSSDLEDGRQYFSQAGQGQRRGRPRRCGRSVLDVQRTQRPRPLAAGPGCGRGDQGRNPKNLPRRAQSAAGSATLETVKAKYKALVKQHHPDANGGDRSTEDRLIEIIKAYNYLKTVVRAGG